MSIAAIWPICGVCLCSLCRISSTTSLWFRHFQEINERFFQLRSQAIEIHLRFPCGVLPLNALVHCNGHTDKRRRWGFRTSLNCRGAFLFQHRSILCRAPFMKRCTTMLGTSEYTHSLSQLYVICAPFAPHHHHTLPSANTCDNNNSRIRTIGFACDSVRCPPMPGYVCIIK